MQQRWTASHIQDVTERHHLFKIFFFLSETEMQNISSKNCDSYRNIYKNNLFFFFFFCISCSSTKYLLQAQGDIFSLLFLSNQQSNTQSKSIFIMHDQ